MTPSENDLGPGQGRAVEDEYALRIEPPSPPTEQSAESDRDLDDRTAAEEETERSLPRSVRGAALRRAFFSGTFAFPFGLDALAKTLGLTAGAVVVTTLIKAALWFAGAGGGGLIGAGAAAGSMFMCVVGGVCLLAWIVPASACGLTVLRDTSYGCESIENWPSLFALDGFVEAVYLLSGAILAAVPGAVVVPLFDRLGIPGYWTVAASELLLFPLFILSLLENDTPMNPIAPAVWRSVVPQWRAWVLFYALTSALAVAFALTDLVTRAAGLLWNATAVGFMLGVAWIVYFRLLGRLARLCSLGFDDDTTIESVCGKDEEILSSGDETWTDR